MLATFDEDQVELLQGEVVEHEYRSDESGRWLKMSFCPACGTTWSHVTEFRPGKRTIAAGTFDEQGWYPIQRHIWVRSKLPWVTIPADVDSYEQGYVAPPA